MAIQLVVRHNLEGHEATFLPGELFTFSMPLIRIGTRPGCECLLAEDPELPQEIGTLEKDSASGRWSLTPARGVPLFLNQSAVEDRVHVRSGDEIRCGHWTLRFHKALPEVRFARRADLLALAAKVLVVLILATEVGLLSWLPRQIQRAQLWELQIARQRTLMMVDGLRKRINPRANALPLEKLTLSCISDQVARLTLYLRENSAHLSRDQLRVIESDVRAYDTLVTRIGENRVFQPVPPLDLDAAFKNALQSSVGHRPAP